MSNINIKSIQLTQANSTSDEINVNEFYDTSRLFVCASGVVAGTFTIEQKVSEATGWLPYPISVSNLSPLIIDGNVTGIQINVTKYARIRFVGSAIVDPEVINIDVVC